MSTLKAALELAKKGFHVFPLIPGGKLPAIDDFPNRATRDPERIRKWWIDPVMSLEQPYNVGISTTRFGDSEALIVIDVDNKGEKNGDKELSRLGKSWPDTFVQLTPSGGRHIFFRVRAPVKQGVDVLGRGLDIRSRHGYVVGYGSSIEGGVYTASDCHISDAPDWLIESCGRSAKRKAPENPPKQTRVDSDSAKARAVEYLKNHAPTSTEGSGGDETAYVVACRVKDFGVDEATAFELLAEHWNDHCSPPWDIEALHTKVQNAYQYGVDPQGVDAPETQFSPVLSPKPKLHPFDELNQEFAFVIAGGGSHILWETKDARELPLLEHLDVETFHRKIASRMLQTGERAQPISKLWMKNESRRSYDGICFMPGKEAPPRFYNLWRGFAVEPLGANEKPSKEAKRSLDMFLEHSLTNVCDGEPVLHDWLISYFAHLVQKPWEKPLVALVFRGKKGTGKNALIERIGHLLGNHFLLTSNRRYLVGNFNGHMENLLLFTLDEAFWSGDKQAEGTLKDLITGGSHVIEHKGKEPYTVANCTRVVIIGNEEWIVPATQDERRFAVFSVGDARLQDRSFFQSMREGMEHGGYQLLLRYLLDYDISSVDLNAAPVTEGLLEQKISSLDPFYQWWLDCLTEGRIIYSEFSSDWPLEIPTENVREAFRRYCRERNIRSRIPENSAIGKFIRHCHKTMTTKQYRNDGQDRYRAYCLPSLGQARIDWQKFIGHDVSWE